ncbi:MAG TPA: hypothetical protein VGI39_09200 [Polyangiaceae bacterium]|jgi:hypothetical protein
MRRHRSTLAPLLCAASLATAPFLVHCEGGSNGGFLDDGGGALWPTGDPGSGTGSTGTGASSDAGVMPTSPVEDASAPSTGFDAGGAPVMVDAALPDAGSCTLGSSGILGLIPGATMSPGLGCVSCHASTGAKKLNVAGTIYPTLHEPDLCLGASTGLQVILTDATGTAHTLSVNGSGNFYDDGLVAFPTPYTAKVVGPNGSIAMMTPQTSGDCNSCHTAAGTQGAAGRIVGP